MKCTYYNNKNKGAFFLVFDLAFFMKRGSGLTIWGIFLFCFLGAVEDDG